MTRRFHLGFSHNFGGDDMNTSDCEFAEFVAWKRQRAAEQAEANRRQKVKQLQREQRDDWERNRRIDAELMQGIEKGMTWVDFVRSTKCPGDLQKRYLELQEQSGIKPGSQARLQESKAFLEGFNRG